MDEAVDGPEGEQASLTPSSLPAHPWLTAEPGGHVCRAPRGSGPSCWPGRAWAGSS